MQQQSNKRKERGSNDVELSTVGTAATAASSSSSSTSSSSPFSSFPPSPSFDTESLASQARRTSRLCGVGGPGLSSVLSLLFSHLTSSRADFPFMLPELQRIIADYAQPERTFMGVTADATEAAGWRIQVMDGNELRARLLQPRMEELIQQQPQGRAVEAQDEREERVAELQARPLDELIADCSEAAPPLLALLGIPHFAAHVAAFQAVLNEAPTVRIYPRLPHEYCIELNGVDRIYCQHPNAQVRIFMRGKLLEDAQRAEEVARGERTAAPAARFCELKPYLKLLFQDAHKEADLPFLPDSLVSLIADSTCGPPDYSFPTVFTFSSPSSPLPLLIESEAVFRRRWQPFISKYRDTPLMMERQFGAVADILMTEDDDWKVGTRDAVGAGKGEHQEEAKQASDPSTSAASSSSSAPALKRSKIMLDLWEEQSADERHSSSFMRFLQSIHVPSDQSPFLLLVRGGAFDHCITWAQAATPKQEA